LSICAVAAFLASAVSTHFVATIGVVGIPCLLVGTLAGQTMSILQAYDKRIAELEKRLAAKRPAGPITDLT
jgi:hypothetical protein